MLMTTARQASSLRHSESRLTSGTGPYHLQTGDLVAVPSGIAYDRMTPEDIVIVDLAGQVIEGHRKPSSEAGFHIALYRKRKDIRAVVHTHSVYATTLACLHWEIPAVHYLVGFSGLKVPLAPYATFGSRELADNLAETIGDFNAVLMANHGLVTVGDDLARAFATAEEIEFVARLYYQARLAGTPKILPEEEMGRVLGGFETGPAAPRKGAMAQRLKRYDRSRRDADGSSNTVLSCGCLSAAVGGHARWPARERRPSQKAARRLVMPLADC
ncbi:MAG: class II aldolase/adducin family protein [Desulfobacterales bacterium]|nr:class II aldolase/adducin family protein [Desulfobacterales bacterium]